MKSLQRSCHKRVKVSATIPLHKRHLFGAKCEFSVSPQGSNWVRQPCLAQGVQNAKRSGKATCMWMRPNTMLQQAICFSPDWAAGINQPPIGPLDYPCIAFSNLGSFLVAVRSPPDGVFHLQGHRKSMSWIACCVLRKGNCWRVVVASVVRKSVKYNKETGLAHLREWWHPGGRRRRRPSNCECLPSVSAWFYLLHPASPHLQIHPRSTADQKACNRTALYYLWAILWRRMRTIGGWQERLTYTAKQKLNLNHVLHLQEQFSIFCQTSPICHFELSLNLKNKLV